MTPSRFPCSSDGPDAASNAFLFAAICSRIDILLGDLGALSCTAGASVERKELNEGAARIDTGFAGLCVRVAGTAFRNRDGVDGMGMVARVVTLGLGAGSEAGA
jgi:hypothetical protein